MTPEERQLIAGLFERMRGFGGPEKDPDAEALINAQVRSMPDAPYMLVQSVLVQEQALQTAQGRIAELEAQLRAPQGAAPRKSGSFLGGYWGGRGEQEASGASVPQVGARATPPAYESGPWSPSSPAPAGPPPAAPAPSGGFLRSALSTAAGVAGGALLADSLRSMLGGAHANPSLSTPAHADPLAATGSKAESPSTQERSQSHERSEDKAEESDADQDDDADQSDDMADDDGDAGFDSDDSGELDV